MRNAPDVHSLTGISLAVTFGALALLGGACGGDSGDGAGSDPAKYGFETDIQGWSTPDSTVVMNLTTSSAQKAAGSKSLEATFAPTMGGTTAYTVEIVFTETLPTIMPGTNATFHVMVPTGSVVNAIQPYLNEGVDAPTAYRWKGVWTASTPGMWQTIQVQAPDDVTPLQKVGVQLFASGPGTGPVYIDSVDWK
jgi:hypothetical protein